MDSKKLSYIKILLMKREDTLLGGPFNLLIHSVLNTINFTELLWFYIPLKNNNLKKSIESNLNKRIKEIDKPQILFSTLKEKLNNCSYNERQRIRSLLQLTLASLDKNYKKEFFDIFIYSKYKNDKKAALNNCGDLWNLEINNMVLNLYLDTKDSEYLNKYLAHGDIELLIPYLEDIWPNLNNYEKMNILKEVCINNMESLDFLRDQEPEKYIYASVLSSSDIRIETLKECYKKTSDKSKPYAILSLSKLKNWNLIEDEIKRYVC